MLALTAGLLAAAAPSAEASRPTPDYTVRIAAKTAELYYTPSISASGRFVVYQDRDWTRQDDSDPEPKILLWDAKTRKSTLVTPKDSPQGVGFDRPSISPDGRYVVYVRDSDYLPRTPEGEGYSTSVLMWDRVTKKTRVVAPKAPLAYYDLPKVSAGGAFVGYAANNSKADQVAKIWRRSTGVTTSIVVRPGAASTVVGSLSDDGRTVVLGVLKYDESDTSETVLWDRVTHKTRSLGDRGGRISGDGKLVAVNLHTAKKSSGIWHRSTGKITKLHIPKRYNPLLKNGWSITAISTTGRYVVVRTYGKTVRTRQLLLVDRSTGGAVVVSRTNDGKLAKDAGWNAVDRKGTAVVFQDGHALRIRLTRK